MANACSANYVDRLLMKIDGAVCPIWNSFFYTVEDFAAAYPLFFECVQALIHETPRLKSIWSPQGRGWLVIEPDEQRIMDAIFWDESPKPKHERLKQLIKAPINLEHSFPFRLSIGKIEDQKWLIGFQLHHAACDGRSIAYLIQRFWDLFNHFKNQQPLTRKPLSVPQMTDKKFIMQGLKHKKSLSYIMSAKHRQLSKRADALSHQGTEVGDPILSQTSIDLTGLHYRHASELFYSALLAAVVQSEAKFDNQLIRLRIPIDLRSIWRVPRNSIENGCAAVMIELPLNLIKDTYTNEPKQLGALVSKALKQLLTKRMYLANALECILISHLSSAKKMKKTISEELLAAKRSSTLVITHFGEVTAFIKPPSPIKVVDLDSHTPVWGANSFVFEGRLYINNTCFDGIWSHDRLDKFSLEAKHWLLSQHSISGGYHGFD